MKTSKRSKGVQINTKPHIHRLVMCSNILVRKGDKYLLLKRAESKRYAPGIVHPYGGKIDKDEDPLKAALRELEEESGITVKNVVLKAVVREIQLNPDLPRNWLVFYFIADYLEGEVIDTEEGKAVFLTQEELKSQLLFPSFAAIAGHIFDRKSGVAFVNYIYDQDSQVIDSKVTVCP